MKAVCTKWQEGGSNNEGPEGEAECSQYLINWEWWVMGGMNVWLWWAYNIGLSLACSNCIAERRRWGGFGWLPWPTVPKARGSGLITGQRGANQGPITLLSARQDWLETDCLRQQGWQKLPGSRDLWVCVCACVCYGKYRHTESVSDGK